MSEAYNQDNSNITTTYGALQDPVNNWISYSRVAFDNIFVIVILILLVEMVSGLVIDTFS